MSTFVPYKQGTDPEFEKCLPDILVQEGVAWTSGSAPVRGFSNDAHDPGGATEEGIIQREYNADRSEWGLPLQSVRLISFDEMRTIYYLKYWLPHCPKLYSGMNLEFFNMSVNGGPARATKNLQKVLGITADGIWGPATDAAVAAIIGHPVSLINAYRAADDAFYRAIPGFKWFGKDWLRRDAEITQQADSLDAALDDFTNNPPKSIMTE
jgi:lysozyme family protein